MRLRVDILALTIHLFDRRPVRYAGAVAGRYGVTSREDVIPDVDGHLRESLGVLFRSWRAGKAVRRDGEECAMPDYEPAVVIDFPVAQGMVGIGFGQNLPDAES